MIDLIGRNFIIHKNTFALNLKIQKGFYFIYYRALFIISYSSCKFDYPYIDIIQYKSKYKFVLLGLSQMQCKRSEKQEGLMIFPEGKTGRLVVSIIYLVRPCCFLGSLTYCGHVLLLFCLHRN